MDSAIHRDLPMKIQRAIETVHLFLYAMWTNPESSSSIVHPGLDRDDSADGRLITTVDRDAPLHRTAAPKSVSINTVLRDGITRP